jgi:hypothetical protein
MPGGEIQLVAYGEENMFLNDDPQITFFKLIYRRYTNFSIETIKQNFNNKLDFGQKYSIELSKIGDLIHKMWMVIELPSIPILYNINNIVDKRLRFAWARKIAYALVDYVDINIGGVTIDTHWGEWMNVLNELNVTNFNNNIDELTGNVPEVYTLTNTSNGDIPNRTLYIPLHFWFCKYAGAALPILAIEYNIVRCTVQLNNFENCAIFSPTNYIFVKSFIGLGIKDEPLLQVSELGYSWGVFDSIEPIEIVGSEVQYKLYYRKISDNPFISTTSEFYNNYSVQNILNNLLNSSQDNYVQNFIYGITSKTIYYPQPIIKNSLTTFRFESIEKQYYISTINLSIKNVYFLIDYIYLDREERTKFFNDRHEYVIEQTYFSGNKILKNLNNKINLEVKNPCKWMVFMGQFSYLTNPNVNDFFNYRTSFIRDIDNNITGDPLIKQANISFNSNPNTQIFDMKFYSRLMPFLYFPRTFLTNGFGVMNFSLYPINTQPSGSINMSLFNSISINQSFNIIDKNYNNYIFKSYIVTYNILRIYHGVCGLVFSTNY